MKTVIMKNVVLIHVPCYCSILTQPGKGSLKPQCLVLHNKLRLFSVIVTAVLYSIVIFVPLLPLAYLTS